MNKTNRDVVIVLFEQLVGPRKAKRMAQDFVRRFGPRSNAAMLNETLTYAEFDEKISRMKLEMPAFKAFLLKSR